MTNHLVAGPIHSVTSLDPTRFAQETGLYSDALKDIEILRHEIWVLRGFIQKHKCECLWGDFEVESQSQKLAVMCQGCRLTQRELPPERKSV